MKTQENPTDNLQHRRFEADLAVRINALFRRWPALCGFSVRAAANLVRDRLAFQDVSDLFVTDVSVYPLSGLRAPEELCLEIVAALLELIDESPGACALLRERSFARVFH